jgi:hypothetical protein
MEYQNFSEQGNQKLPNATAVLVLGILSVFTFCCYGIIGLILGIVALVLAKKDKAIYNENPTKYTNYSNLKTGRILAIIGIVLSIIFIIYVIWFINIIGMDALQDEELMRERIMEYFGS